MSPFGFLVYWHIDKGAQEQHKKDVSFHVTSFFWPCFTINYCLQVKENLPAT
jgi:hypothetical protein